MEKAEAEEYIGKDVRLILSNNFKFSGKVINVSDSEIIIIDKFNSRVIIKFSDIMVFTEVNNER